jgi:hypothetical protein
MTLSDWMTWLEARHLADLQFPEVARALRALSSAYVERRQTAIPEGRVLDSAGKRAAFALYYGPLHFLAAGQVLEACRARVGPAAAPRLVVDLGCGTGAVGVAAATVTGGGRVLGVDVHPWAVAEARATYAHWGLEATVKRSRVAGIRLPDAPSLIVAGYVANELGESDRHALLAALRRAILDGSTVLVMEPLSGRAAPWWPDWVGALAGAGAVADAWTLELDPPSLTRRLGVAAGLTPTQAKLRTIYAGGAIR